MIRYGTERGNREHRFVSDRLSAYIDERLNHRDRLRVETHLSTCAQCRADLHSLRWTRRLLQQAPPIKIPRSFVLREADVAPRPVPGARLRLVTVQWATAAVALLFVLVLGIDLLGGVGLRGAQRQEAAMLATTAPQAVEEVVVATVEVAKERAAPQVGAPAPPDEDASKDTPTAAGEAEKLAAESAPTEAAAKTIGPAEGAAGTPTPAPAQEALAAEAPEETPTPESTEVSLLAQVLEPTPEQHTVASGAEPTAPPQAEQDTVAVESLRDEVRPSGGRSVLWIAEVVLGLALLALVGTLVWLRQRAS